MSDLVKVEVQVPPASWAIQNAARQVVADVTKALSDGWQPGGDVTAIVLSVVTNFSPLGGSFVKVPAELVAYPTEMARLGGLVLGDLAGFVLKKVRG